MRGLGNVVTRECLCKRVEGEWLFSHGKRERTKEEQRGGTEQGCRLAFGVGFIWCR